VCKRMRATVKGRVQGVFFRDSTRQMAAREGVSGWVRNLADGRVEAVFEGEPDAVDRAVAWLHDGPPRARVDSVVAESENPEGLLGFEIRG
jgi:acylphosphatase